MLPSTKYKFIPHFTGGQKKHRSYCLPEGNGLNDISSWIGLSLMDTLTNTNSFFLIPCSFSREILTIIFFVDLYFQWFFYAAGQTVLENRSH